MKFYFEISEEAKLCSDKEGNYGPCYCSMDIPIHISKEREDKLNVNEDKLIGYVASNLMMDAKWFRRIPESEYIEKSGEDY